MSDAPTTRLQVLQRGKEVTAGTLVAATHRVPFKPDSLKFTPVIDRIRRRYSGSGATSHSSDSGLSHIGVSWDEQGTYDYLAVALEGVLGTAVITGATADKSWAMLPSDSAPDGVPRYSLEMGGRDTWADEEKVAGCVLSSLEIKWNKADDWELALDYMGVRNTQATKTGSLTLPTALQFILGRLTRVYVDPTTFGSTAWARGVSGSIKIENELSERFGSDGNDYPNRIVVLQRNVTASLIVEYDATSKVGRTAWRAGTVEKLRIGATGPTLGATAYSAAIDIPGTWDTNEISDDNGIVTLACDLTAQYNSSLGADVAATVVCSLTAVP